ncbi:hypothetical protein [Aureimonas sp. Leaf454]|uniref:hypothetical protein n=1 Tax=Aureimonas sp. Leaf454 TaxID=1736381 RepID=UPI00070043E8|nr:hypothetical protein [Aureimonas sp. Leaf454]
MSLFAFRLIADHYELNDEKYMGLAAELSDNDLRVGCEDEVSEFVSGAIQSDPTRFTACDDIDAISSQPMLDKAYCYEVASKGDAPSARIYFRASVTVPVTPTYDHEEAASKTFPVRRSVTSVKAR